MKRSVLQPFLIVFVVWALGLWVADGMPVSLPDTEKAMRVLIISLATVVFVGLMRLFYRQIGGHYLKGGEAKQARSTIGPVPGYLPPRQAGGEVDFSASRWPHTHEWLHQGDDEYRRLFRAVLGVMATKPGLPASPEPTGHGGCTLLEHSLNVVETGLREVDYWIVDRKNHRNEGMPVPPEGRDLMPLVLLSHDLGKITAFQTAPKDDTTIIKKKAYHDRESARLLGLMEESWALSEDEHNDLIMAVSHEHHPQDIPDHATDQARILMEFLIYADRLASANEDRVYSGEPALYSDMEGEPVAADVASGSSSSHPSHPKSGQAASHTKASRKNHDGASGEGAHSTAEGVADGEDISPGSSSPSSTSEGQHTSATSRVAGDALDRTAAAEYQQMWDWLRDVIARPGSVNGNRKNFRVGFWDGKRLYLNEARVRKLLADEFYGDPARGREQAGDGRYKITAPFLEALDHAGVLVKEFDGDRWNAKNALFRVMSSDPETGKTLEAGAWNSALVLEFSADTLPVVLGGMEPAPKPPKIVAARWPQHALRSPRPEPEPEVEPEVAVEDESAAEPAESKPVQEKADGKPEVEMPEGWGTLADLVPEKPSRKGKGGKPKPEQEKPRADTAPEPDDDPLAALDPLKNAPKKGRRKASSPAPDQEHTGWKDVEPETADTRQEAVPDNEEAADESDFSEDDLYAQYENFDKPGGGS